MNEKEVNLNLASTPWEDQIILDTVREYLDTGRTEREALNAVARVLLHRNKRGITRRYHQLKANQEISEEDVKAMIDKIDDVVDYLQEVSKNLERLQQSEADLIKLLEAIHEVDRREKRA